MNPLTITNSPCAKFTTSVALKIRTKPSAMSAYTQPVASPLTTWLVRISTMRRAAPRLLAPADFLELHPLARLRPLTVLHDDEPARVAHAAAIVAAVRVLQAPARIPVLDRLHRPEHRVAGEALPGAPQGIGEHRRLLIAVQVRGVDRRSEERRVGKECRSRWWPYH